MNQTNETLNILILYDRNSLYTNTVRDYLESFSLFSRNRIFYAHASYVEPVCLSLSMFDVVVIHYSIRLSFTWHIAQFYKEEVKKSSCLKILFVQDEYDETETLRNSIKELGINVVFTCVPQQYIEYVYPTSRFPNVLFVQTLTGWIPSRLENNKKFKPLHERTNLINYRGRPLPYWYGDLGQEKINIGKMLKKICQERHLTIDIEWEEDKRIYGDQWNEFLSNSRATLGTESGSNIFDDYGEIRKQIAKEIANNPNVTYEEIREKYLIDHENKIKMNQISPKLFEAIALKTALILFEGSYSGILQPNLHYIPLKKDLSNVDEVLANLQNISYLEEITERAFNDIFLSGKYNYKQFVFQFDNVVSKYNIKNNCLSSLTIQQHFDNIIQSDKLTIQNLKSKNHELESILSEIKSGKFWKLYTVWIKLKQFILRFLKIMLHSLKRLKLLCSDKPI
jgi:hypothetical protein